MPNLWKHLNRLLERPAISPVAPLESAEKIVAPPPGLRRRERPGLDQTTSIGIPDETDRSTKPHNTARPGNIRRRAVRRDTGRAVASLGDFDLADVAERAVSATVTIYTSDGMGSGFIVDSSGLVVTGRHVVASSNDDILRSVRVRLANDHELDGTVVRFHRRLDFALLWLDSNGPFPALTIGEPTSLRAAETVLAIGSPSAFRNTVSRGVVSNPRQMLNGVECIQTDASIDHGNSGGPLVNRHGEAVAINLWGWGTLASGKFALPVDYLRDDIDSAVRCGRDRCLQGMCCPFCGNLEIEKPTWYCRNCGTRQPGMRKES